MKVADEYDGGDKVAEFFADFFVVAMMFPLNLLGLFDFQIFSALESIWVIMYILSSFISGFMIVSVLNFLYLNLLAFLKRLVQTRL